MKTAFTTSGKTLDAPLDSRFGRAPAFLVHDDETGGFEIVDNAQNLNAPLGAGIQAARNVAASGAGRLVTGHCGPKAFRVLKAAGIDVLLTQAETIAEALKQIREGGLRPAETADVEGHWA